MADTPKTKTAGGCFGKLLVLFLLATAVGLVIAVVFIIQPQDLSDLRGPSVAPRDLKVVLQNSIDRGYPVTLTEAEINQWLGRTLTAKQGGLLASKVSLKRVWVRLQDGCAEVVMERRIFDRPFTVSMFLKVEQSVGLKGQVTEVQMHGGPYCPGLPHPLTGGRFGRAVVPQGFLLLVLPSYQKLASLYQNELHLAFESMARIKIQKGRLVLDPREPTSDLLELPPPI